MTSIPAAPEEQTMPRTRNGLQLRQLQVENPVDIAAFQAVLEAAPRYSLMIEGKLPSADAAEQDLRNLPPGKCQADKYCALISDPSGRAIGVCDLVRGYPEAGIAFLGLLLFIEGEQGRGYGPQALSLLQEMARSWACRQMRLAVVAANTRGWKFWQTQGFVEIYRKPSAQYLSELIVMQRAL